ncbi:catechol 2,3-dioxygenase-like lactoylglutathione lyase family enzyme [Agromyces hippuratus]|uniref:Catechol 2,3-dioxygenase-like lactoylglutathione lyase family enzyme n=1 Tax=Agromyces hippuratus TaxID=286438 RepID=A0A852WRN4_9MICO|nr:VOC family protein [Agromyces hippuratus]NYG20872.1 catechol 2,3-dioxygenase-like lactoylglutathione lyase family enzyme [Agromyces hippuratus]
MNLYPVLGTTDVQASAGFYREHFGFDVTFDTDWYVSLRHPLPPHAEIALLDAAHQSIPADFRVPAAGVIVNIEVDDVDVLASALEAAGVPIAQELRSEGFGQRHVIVRDPGGVLVDVITPIPPSDEYAASFAADGAAG